MERMSERCKFQTAGKQCEKTVGHVGSHEVHGLFHGVGVTYIPQDPVEVSGYPYPDKAVAQDTSFVGPPHSDSDTIDHPIHYGGDITYEHWKVMVAWGLDKNAFLYNCTKYICRSGGAYVGRKNAANPLEDLEKARWYLDRAIEQCKESS